MCAAETIDVQGTDALRGAVPLLDLLNAGSDVTRAMFVGGCVRDALLGLPLGDIDIATTIRPPDVMARLEAAGYRAVPTGIEYGTVTAVLDGRTAEITTLRRDVETDGRRAVVAYSDDWAEDAARRDFTINTLLADRDGRVVDPLGQGLPDLRAGAVRFVGDAATRIAEDHLRILRFFRFYGRFGRGAPDPDALNACRDAAATIGRLSRERITSEFLRILSADNAAETLDVMFGANVMADLPSFDYSPAQLRALIDAQRQWDGASVTARLALLAAFRTNVMDRLEQWLVLPRRDVKQLGTLSALVAQPAPRDVRLTVAEVGNALALQAVLCRAALRGEQPDPGDATIAARWAAPIFPITGDDLIAVGATPGREMGEVLDSVRRWWAEAGFQADRTMCLAEAKRRLGIAAG